MHNILFKLLIEMCKKVIGMLSLLFFKVWNPRILEINILIMREFKK